MEPKGGGGGGGGGRGGGGGGLEQGEAPLTTAMVHAVARRHRDGGPVRWGGEAALDMGPTGWNRLGGGCPTHERDWAGSSGSSSSSSSSNNKRPPQQQATAQAIKPAYGQPRQYRHQQQHQPARNFLEKTPPARSQGARGPRQPVVEQRGGGPVERGGGGGDGGGQL